MNISNLRGAAFQTREGIQSVVLGQLLLVLKKENSTKPCTKINSGISTENSLTLLEENIEALNYPRILSNFKRQFTKQEWKKVKIQLH